MNRDDRETHLDSLNDWYLDRALPEWIVVKPNADPPNSSEHSRKEHHD